MRPTASIAESPSIKMAGESLSRVGVAKRPAERQSLMKTACSAIEAAKHEK